jgi:hypothetical protein
MPRPARYLLIWAGALLALLAVVAGVNIVVNPYDLFDFPRIRGVNVLKPAIKNHAALTKAYQVERARPVTAVLGTSRVYLGIDAASPEFPASFRPVYNYGLPGTNMSRSLLRELREAWSTGNLRHVVAFLDVPAFLEVDQPVHGEEDERRLRYLDNGAPNPAWREQRLHDAFLSIVTLAALTDSVRTVLAQRGRDGGGDTVLDLRSDGTSTDADFAAAAHAEGMNAVFAQKDEYDLSRIPTFQQTLANWHGLMPNLGVVREMIRFCREHDLTLTLILGSSHADGMEIYRRAGLWPWVEQLKIDIASLVAEARGDTVTAWDFVEYSGYTTEKLPPPGDRVTPIHWFWEPVHFKMALGEVMLRRVFSGAPADFGAPLTSETVAVRNQAVREQQRAFIGWQLACETNPQSTCAPPPAAATEASR